MGYNAHILSDAPTTNRTNTILGWIAGASLAVLVSYGLFQLGVYRGAAERYIPLTTFVLFVIGAFSGMAIADRVGDKGTRILGIAAGLLFAVAASLVMVTALGSG